MNSEHNFYISFDDNRLSSKEDSDVESCFDDKEAKKYEDGKEKSYGFWDKNLGLSPILPPISTENPYSSKDEDYFYNPTQELFAFENETANISPENFNSCDFFQPEISLSPFYSESRSSESEASEKAEKVLKGSKKIKKAEKIPNSTKQKSKSTIIKNCHGQLAKRVMNGLKATDFIDEKFKTKEDFVLHFDTLSQEKQEQYKHIGHFVHRLDEETFLLLKKGATDYLENYNEKYKSAKNLKAIKRLCFENQLGIGFAFLMESYCRYGKKDFQDWMNNFRGGAPVREYLMTEHIFKDFENFSVTWKLDNKN